MTTAVSPGDMIYLKEGHVIGMTLPLHPDIEARWRAGFLTRVTADGQPWQAISSTSCQAGRTAVQRTP